MKNHSEFRSGSAADTQAITDNVKYKHNFAEIEKGIPTPVKDASMTFKYICLQGRSQGRSHCIWLRSGVFQLVVACMRDN